MRPMRLLMVDDEKNVLEALRRLLRRLRSDWEVRTANSALEALALLEQEPADVLITDMRMPGMDGAGLLAAVKERAPSAVRVVLSGETDDATALRVMPLAHQFLSKPCDPKDPSSVCWRGYAMRSTPSTTRRSGRRSRIRRVAPRGAGRLRASPGDAR